MLNQKQKINKIIWELANRSGFDVDPTGKFGNYSEMYRVYNFAKAIVTECLNVVSDCMEYSNYDDHYISMIELKTQKEIREILEEHFYEKE